MGFYWESDLWNPWNNQLQGSSLYGLFKRVLPKQLSGHMSSLNWVLIVWRESPGSPLGVRWESAGSPLGVRWESAGSTLGVRWEYAGSTLGVRWEFTNGLPKELSKWTLHIETLESTGSPLGDCSESTSSLLGVHWESTSSLLGVRWD